MLFERAVPFVEDQIILERSLRYHLLHRRKLICAYIEGYMLDVCSQVGDDERVCLYTVERVEAGAKSGPKQK